MSRESAIENDGLRQRIKLLEQRLAAYETKYGKLFHDVELAFASGIPVFVPATGQTTIAPSTSATYHKGSSGNGANNDDLAKYAAGVAAGAASR